jgi:maltooligosyltrehalose trehalohydrolase
VSRHQPHGPHGPSRVVDPSAFRWTDGGWRAPALRDLVIYELHVGTFTPEGTFDAAAARLAHVRELGVTAIEIMPVAEFPGARNWGYDGVALFAPQSSYGGPDGLKRLIDAAHGHGLAVVLDVVYNHLGPDGNYLADFGPYFTRRYRTPWGEAVNYDGPDSDEVRRFFIDNALYWLTEYHVDALRLDAIHGIFDFGALHILDEMKQAVAAEMTAAGRAGLLIAESDLEDVRIINPRSAGGYDMDAQWSDSFHHALFTILTAPPGGGRAAGFADYFLDFGDIGDLAKAIAEGFVYDGRRSLHRRRRHGSSSVGQPGEKLVVFTQNHDQIANGARGLRLDQLVAPEACRLAAAVLLCAPNVPLLFMGQEWAAATPFFYFTSHQDPALGEAVSAGRRREFVHLASAHLAGAHERGDWADPQDAETFARSRLDWTSLAKPSHAAMLRLYRDLIALRRETPALCNARRDLTTVAFSEEHRWLTVARSDPGGSRATLIVNLSPRPQPIPVPGSLPPFALFTEDARYGGPAVDAPAVAENELSLPPWSAAVLRS